MNIVAEMEDRSGNPVKPQGWEGRRLATLVAQTRVVVAKELRSSARGWRLFAVLTAYLCFLALPLLVAYLSAASMEAFQRFSAGRTVFLPTIGFELAIVCFIAPALAAGSIAGERERQTYDLLLCTPLSSWAVVLGKLISALAYLLLLAVAALPLQSVAIWMGGVAPEEVGIGLVLVVTVAVAYAAVGIFFSSTARSSIMSTVGSYVAILLVAGGIPLLLGVTLLFMSRLGQAQPQWMRDPAPWLVYLTGAIASLNPLVAGGITEVALIGGRSAFVFWETIGHATVLVISPWLVFTLLHLVLAGFLLRGAAARVRRSAEPGRAWRAGKPHRSKEKETI